STAWVTSGPTCGPGKLARLVASTASNAGSTARPRFFPGARRPPLRAKRARGAGEPRRTRRLETTHLPAGKAVRLLVSYLQDRDPRIAPLIAGGPLAHMLV